MYNVRWRLEFQDELGRQKRADVLERDYSGSITEVEGAGFSPLTISLQNSGDEKYDTVKSTEISLSIYAETNFEFEEISTATDKQFKIEVYEDNSLKHVGYVIPEIYTEPYTATPYPVTLRATSLGLLNNIRYLDGDGEFYTGVVPAMTVIRRCLDKLDLGLDIWDSVNTWETRMNTGISPLLQVDIDQAAYIVDDRGAVRPMHCIDVLEAVLKPFVVNFFQDYGRWVIIPIEQRASRRSVRIFNSAGALKNTIQRDPVESITWIDQDQQLQPRPIVREVESEYEHGDAEDIIRRGAFNTEFIERYAVFPGVEYIPDSRWTPSSVFDFNSFRPNPTTGQLPVEEKHEGAGLKWRWNAHADIVSPFPPVLIREGAYYEYNGDTIEFDDTQINFVLRFSFRVNTNRVSAEDEVQQRIQFRVGNWYLSADGSWTTTPTDIEFEDLSSPTYFYEWTNIEINTQQLPESGEIRARIYRPTNSNDRRVPDVIFSEYQYFEAGLLIDGQEQPESTTFLGERDVESYANAVDYPVMHGDGPTNLHARSFFINGLQTHIWNRGNLSGSITEIAINEIFREYHQRSNVINGTQRCAGLFDRYFAEFGEAYTPISGTYDERMCFFNGQNIQIQAGDVHGTVRKVEERPPGGQSSGFGGGDVRPALDRLKAIGEITRDYDNEESITLDTVLDQPVRKGIEYWVVNESELSRVNRFAGVYPVIPVTTDAAGNRIPPDSPEYDDEENVREYGPGEIPVPIQEQRINAPAGSLIYKSPANEEFEQYFTEVFQVTTSAHLVSLDETTNANSNSIFQIETTVTELDGEIEAIGSVILGIESDITNLETGVSGNASSILALDTRVTSNEDGIDAVASALIEVESDVEDLESGVSGNASSILALDTRVTSNEGNISSNASAILAAESRITDAENDIDANADTVLQLDSEVQVIDGEIATLKSTAVLKAQISSGEITRMAFVSLEASAGSGSAITLGADQITFQTERMTVNTSGGDVIIGNNLDGLKANGRQVLIGMNDSTRPFVHVRTNNSNFVEMVARPSGDNDPFFQVVSGGNTVFKVDRTGASSIDRTDIGSFSTFEGTLVGANFLSGDIQAGPNGVRFATVSQVTGPDSVNPLRIFANTNQSLSGGGKTAYALYWVRPN